MIQRVLIAVLVGIVVGIVIYVIGMAIALVPGVAVIGEFLKAVSWLLGLAAGIWYYISGRTVL